MRHLVLAQQLHCPLGYGNITILPAFAVADVQHTSFAVDVSHSNLRALLQPESARVNRRKTHSMARQFHAPPIIVNTSSTLRITGSFFSCGARTRLRVVNSRPSVFL